MKILGVDIDNIQDRPIELRCIWNGHEDIRHYKKDDFVNYMKSTEHMVDKYESCEWKLISITYLD